MTEKEAGSPYLKIAGDIEQRIRNGELRPGDRVPSTRQITKEWGVAIATATKALSELGARGVVRAIPGVGTVVAQLDPASADDSSATQTKFEAVPAGRLAVRPNPVADAAQRRPGSGAITRERIISVAIGIADGEGLGALSMRRIAVDMGVATMSLYRSITSKEDLVVGMMDRLLGSGAWPANPPDGWRAQLEYVARRQWMEYREHPWLAHVVSLTRPQLAPGAMAHTDWVLRALDPYDLDPMTRLYIVLTLFGHVKGAATGLDAEREAERDTGVDMQEWMRINDDAFTVHIQSGKFPSLAKLDNNPEMAPLNLTELFEFGLTILLDGLTELIEKRPERIEKRPTT